MANGPSKSMWIRMFIVMLVMVVGTFSVLSVRLAIIMIAESEFYQGKAADQQLYDTELSPTRGNVYDCNMNTLATSATAWTVYITPNDFKDKLKTDADRETVKAYIADKLSEILAIPRDRVYEYTNKSSSYVIVKRKVEKPEADKIRELIASGEHGIGRFIGLDESTKRYYPNDNLASVILGFVGDENQGLGGLEAYYDNSLTGTPGRVVAAKNAHGADMPFSYEKIVDATPGNSLVLTIDKYIQYVTEKHLEQAVIENKASERGVAIVMDVNTGGILAMAVKGDFNPNDPFTLSTEDSALLEGLGADEKSAKLSQLRNRQWRNKGVSDTNEPGSVFKVITAAAAIEENITNTAHNYNCPGYIVIAGKKYNCHKTSGHGTQNLTQAMQTSCNPALISIGSQLGVPTFSKYFDAFGLTQRTGIDLPGESSPIYHKEANMGPVELASTAFGQTFKITPIQMITAICATINGGYLVQPHMVSEIVDAAGNTVKSVAKSVKRQVISTKTSDVMKGIIEAVVDGGGGKNAYVAGFRIGGKTGTSEKVAEMIASGTKGLYVSSFCGVAPMDNPEIAVLVIVDEPKGGQYYGSAVAAPAGGAIFAEIMPYLGYEPQYTSEQLSAMAISVPQVVGKSLTDAKAAIISQGLSVKVIGNGTNVERQLPSSTYSINKKGVVVLYTEATTNFTMTTVPDFSGLTVTGVNSMATNSNININFSGADLTLAGMVAYKQSIEPGTAIEVGNIVTVHFRSGDVLAD